MILSATRPVEASLRATGPKRIGLVCRKVKTEFVSVCREAETTLSSCAVRPRLRRLLAPPGFQDPTCECSLATLHTRGRDKSRKPDVIMGRCYAKTNDHGPLVCKVGWRDGG